MAMSALVPTGAQQWMCAATPFEVKLAGFHAAWTSICWATGSRFIAADPVPGDITGGTTFAPERKAVKSGANNIDSALAAGAGSIRAAAIIAHPGKYL